MFVRQNRLPTPTGRSRSTSSTQNDTPTRLGADLPRSHLTSVVDGAEGPARNPSAADIAFRVGVYAPAVAAVFLATGCASTGMVGVSVEDADAGIAEALLNAEGTGDQHVDQAGPVSGQAGETPTEAATGPIAETPHVETPGTETAATETAATETAATETAATETAATETPATETAATETPVIEIPPIEAPVIEAPARVLTGNERVLVDKVSSLVDGRFGGDFRAGFNHYAGSDGTLDMSELEDMLKDARVGNFFTRGVWANDVMKNLDKDNGDNDGRISWPEFLTVYPDAGS